MHNHTPPTATPRENGRAHTKLEWANFILLIFVLGATATAAAFAGLQWCTAKDTERRSLRAYLTINLGDTNVIASESPTHITVNARVLGSTPAYNVRGRINIGFWEKVLTDDELAQVDKPFERRAERYVINPAGDVMSIAAGEWTPTREQFFDITNDLGYGKFFALGKFTYSDAFNCYHFISYCYRMTGPGPANAKECPGRNNSDDPALCTPPPSARSGD